MWNQARQLKFASVMSFYHVVIKNACFSSWLREVTGICKACCGYFTIGWFFSLSLTYLYFGVILLCLFFGFIRFNSCYLLVGCFILFTAMMLCAVKQFHSSYNSFVFTIFWRFFFFRQSQILVAGLTTLMFDNSVASFCSL